MIVQLSGHEVVRVAIENAVSVAGVLLLSEGTMTERRQEEKFPATESPSDGM